MTDLSKLSDEELTTLYKQTRDPFEAALSAEGEDASSKPSPTVAPQAPAKKSPIQAYRERQLAAKGVQEGDVLNRLNQPFTVKFAAQKAVREAGEGYEVAEVKGGFVARKTQPAKEDGNAAGEQTAIKGEAANESPFDEAAHQAATSPKNDLPEPTPAQREAGNFQMGHVKVAGLDVTIEHPAGSIRKGVAADGTPWERPMKSHYGYIKGTTGADGDHVDVYLGPRPDAANAFVVDQVKADGTFDEHKVMLGYTNKTAATLAYKAHYPSDFKVGPVKAVPMKEFKDWLSALPNAESENA